MPRRPGSSQIVDGRTTCCLTWPLGSYLRPQRLVWPPPRTLEVHPTVAEAVAAPVPLRQAIAPTPTSRSPTGRWNRLAQCAAWSCPSRTRRQTRACSSDTPTQTWSLPPAVCWFMSISGPPWLAHVLHLAPGDVANADVEPYAGDTTTENACPREGTLVVTAPNDSVSHTLPVALPICSATISSVDWTFPALRRLMKCSLVGSWRPHGRQEPHRLARDHLPFWSGQYTAMASLMNCAACALVIPCDSSSL
jgi:hypothetical protein